MGCWAYTFLKGCLLQLLRQHCTSPQSCPPSHQYEHPIVACFAAWCRRQTWSAALSVCPGSHIWQSAS